MLIPGRPGPADQNRGQSVSEKTEPRPISRLGKFGWRKKAFAGDREGQWKLPSLLPLAEGPEGGGIPNSHQQDLESL